MRDKLKELRIEAKLNQNDLAKILGITRSAYSNYEQGIREPSVDTIKKICRFYKISADYLLGLDEETDINDFQQR